MGKKINKRYVPPKELDCGLIRELYGSKNLSIAYNVVHGETKRHRQNLEKIYYVERGSGEVIIDDEVTEIVEGDLIEIPKNSWHHLKRKGKTLEVLVITCPNHSEEEVIFDE